jgi:hypothetical protein
MEQALLPWLTRGVIWFDKAMAVPAVRSWFEILRELVGISGAFWLLSKFLGRAALLIHRLLDHSLAELFAVAYNLALAVLYSSVLVYAAIAERGGRSDFFAFQAAGFVMCYVVLGATYREPSGRLSEYALPGYVGGLASYLFFCVKTKPLSNPVTPKLYEALTLFLRSGAARYVTLLAVAIAVVESLRRLRFYLLFRFPPSPRRKIKRVNLETP